MRKEVDLAHLFVPDRIGGRSDGGSIEVSTPSSLAGRHSEAPTTASGEEAQPEEASCTCSKEAHHFAEQTNYLPPSKLIPIFLALALIDFVALIDQTTLSVALAIIGAEFNAGSQVSFISSAYFISSTACQLLYGRVSDITGRKVLLLAGIWVVFFGSLASSLATDVISLSVFRGVTGLGGGGLMTIAQIIVSDVVSLRQRGKYQGILGAVVALANGIGPVIGGALASTSTWRNIFRLMLPLSFLGGVAVWFFMPLKPVEGDWRQKSRAIDWLGAFLSFAAALLLVLGFTWASEYAWDDTHVLGPLLAGLATSLAFVLWQGYGCSAERPALMPLGIFKSGVVCGACITQTINGWLFVTQVYMIPQFYQLAYGYSATRAGSLLLPLTVVQTAASTLSGLLITWTGRYREILLVGWALWAVGLGLFSTLDSSSGLGKQIGYSLLAGVGVGATLQPSLIAIQGAVPRKEMAAVTATRNFVRNLGGALGLALAGTVLNKSATAALLPLGWSGERVRAALSHSGTLLAGGAADAADGAALREAYRRGFQRVFQLLASLAGAAFVVAALLMKHRDVDRDDDERLRLEAQARSHARSSEERSGAGVEEEKRHTPQPA